MAAAFAAKAGTLSDRYPNAFVKTTPTGILLKSEINWKGHVKKTTELKEVSGDRWFLVEPLADTRRHPPLPVPSTNLYVNQIIYNGATNKGVWLQGRTVVIP